MDDVTELGQLVLRERRARDRGWWDAMSDAYTPTARVRLSWIDGTAEEFVAGSRSMAAGGTRATHRMGPPIVDIVGDRALIEASAAICVRAFIEGCEVDLVSHARLLYRAERAAAWSLTRLEALYETDTITPVVPGVSLTVDGSRLARGRDSYRWLAYVLGGQGHAVGDDLPGDDRPASVDAVYAEASTWLRGARSAA